ncbi:hypothetical protein BpHYR1_047059 [Brachionus plicatilis]|uniref:Uncharacterized protein n=1 Tax=Brachionus plicatilis TaxID=10195 RepID=A0A3M7RY47_BRAPC|nr:hypothetical protein BpHYR1_047059 [Brachionus plicatilis]
MSCRIYSIVKKTNFKQISRERLIQRFVFSQIKKIKLIQASKTERKFLHDNNETNSINQEEDMFDDGDYYYAKPKLQTTTIKSRNFSYQSNSTGISSNPIESSRSASSASSTGSNNQKSEIFHSPNLINTSDATSSGITSASVTSSLINSDDYNDDMSEKSNEFSVNKIKYNAKTNKFSTQDSSKAAKIYRPGRKKYEHSSLNRKQTKEVKNCLNEYSGVSLDVDASNSSSEKKNWNQASPAKSNCSIEINDSQNCVPPFPTCHFKDKLPLESSSSLTMVSRLPTSSFSYITNQEAKKNLSSDSSSSSSSGCSSMTQQVCTKHEVGKFYTLLNDKNPNKSKKKNVNFVNQRNSLCVNMDHNSKCLRPFDKKELIYSSNFKPVLKSINSAGKNLLIEESPNKYHTSTFKPNKIDYV